MLEKKIKESQIVQIPSEYFSLQRQFQEQNHELSLQHMNLKHEYQKIKAALGQEEEKFRVVQADYQN